MLPDARLFTVVQKEFYEEPSSVSVNSLGPHEQDESVSLNAASFDDLFSQNGSFGPESALYLSQIIEQPSEAPVTRLTVQ